MWMKFVAFFLCVLLLLCAYAPSLPAQVLLNEILADPATDWDGDGEVGSRADEWVEVINLGASNVDISGFRLGDLSGGMTWRYAFSGVLAPGEVVVVRGSEAQAWQTANGLSALGLSLNNAGDTVFLYEIAGDDTATVDEYTYGSQEGKDDRSTGRSIEDPQSWVLYDGLNPYSGAEPPVPTGCEPTPGLPNECVPSVPVEESTWGAIKQLYSE
jgi:hypothetical protein